MCHAAESEENMKDLVLSFHRGFQGSKSDGQAWQQSLFLTKPFHRPPNLLCGVPDSKYSYFVGLTPCYIATDNI